MSAATEVEKDIRNPIERILYRIKVAYKVFKARGYIVIIPEGNRVRDVALIARGLKREMIIKLLAFILEETMTVKAPEQKPTKEDEAQAEDFLKQIKQNLEKK